ncbi:hypothetical protein CsatB_024292 [Cannabis sativa]
MEGKGGGPLGGRSLFPFLPLEESNDLFRPIRRWAGIDNWAWSGILSGAVIKGPTFLTPHGGPSLLSLEYYSITFLEQLSKDFKKQFQDAIDGRLEASSLTNIKQLSGESLKAYLSRFSTAAAKVRNLNNIIQLTAFQAAITTDLSTAGRELWDDLQGRPVRNINKFNERT